MKEEREMICVMFHRRKSGARENKLVNAMDFVRTSLDASLDIVLRVSSASGDCETISEHKKR